MIPILVKKLDHVKPILCNKNNNYLRVNIIIYRSL